MKRRYSTVLAIGALCLFSCFTRMPALAVETTLYVAKHFEVRDHDQPTKYVFNGDTRIARITGSLSTNTRIQRFRLHAGWNLHSLAVSATNLSEQLQKPGVVASAHSWNAQTGTYSPVPQVASSGTVLWVNATTNTTLGVVGTYVDPVHRQITAGATYLASTGLEAWTPTLPPSVAAWSFDPQSSSLNFQPTWHARLTGDLSSINDLPNTLPPGQVLYVINNAPFELEIPDPALRIRYYHQDHLGSSSVMTDADGVLVEETAFYPFGIPRHEHRLRAIDEPYKFTQKELDQESGLHYFEARYLTGRLARFGSPDPKYADIDAAPSDPQALNLYAYAHSNPLRFVDPTGLEDKENDDDDDGGFADFVLGGARALGVVDDAPVPKESTPRSSNKASGKTPDPLDLGPLSYCENKLKAYAQRHQERSEFMEKCVGYQLASQECGGGGGYSIHNGEQVYIAPLPVKHGKACLSDYERGLLEGSEWRPRCESDYKSHEQAKALDWWDCFTQPPQCRVPSGPSPFELTYQRLQSTIQINHEPEHSRIPARR